MAERYRLCTVAINTWLSPPGKCEAHRVFWQEVVEISDYIRISRDLLLGYFRTNIPIMISNSEQFTSHAKSMFKTKTMCRMIILTGKEARKIDRSWSGIVIAKKIIPMDLLSIKSSGENITVVLFKTTAFWEKSRVIFGKHLHPHRVTVCWLLWTDGVVEPYFTKMSVDQ